MKRLSLLALAALGLASPLCAGLEFAQKKVVYPVRYGDTEAVAVFPFKNTGDKAVTITNLVSNCGCTSGKLDKKTYAPNDSGEVTLIFKFGARVGPQRKLLMVSTDADKAPIILALETDIPELLKITPQLVVWGRGDTRKTVSITCALPPRALSTPALEYRNLAATLAQKSPTEWTLTLARTLPNTPSNTSPTQTRFEIPLTATFSDTLSHSASLWILTQ